MGRKCCSGKTGKVADAALFIIIAIKDVTGMIHVDFTTPIGADGADLGWSEWTAITNTIKDKYGVTITLEEQSHIFTVHDIVTLVVEKMNAAGG